MMGQGRASGIGISMFSHYLSEFKKKIRMGIVNDFL
jgi:hypothetical protein